MRSDKNLHVLVDSRILPVKRDRAGRRSRSAFEYMSEGGLEHFSDWPVPGPRSAEWQLADMTKGGMNVVGVCSKYRTDLTARVRASDLKADLENPLLDTLGFYYELFEYGLAYDQLQCWNLAVGELICRRTQQAKPALNADPMAQKVELDQYFLGTALTRNSGMFPDLNDWIAERLKADQKLLVNRRFLNEENGKGDDGRKNK